VRWVRLLAVLIGASLAQLAPPEDLACAQGPNAAIWGTVKQRFRSLFEDSSGLFRTASREEVKNVLDTAIAELKAVNGFDKDDCGFGKLLLQLLNIALLEDPDVVPRVFRETEIVSSPVMTTLLDLPWVQTALTGWPFFGVLAQISHAKLEILNGTFDNTLVDGLEDAASKSYFEALSQAQLTDDLGAMAVASVSYLEKPKQHEHVFGLMTALAVQTAVQPNVDERVSLLQGIQNAMRSVITNVPELEVGLTIRWPLWRLLHVSVDALSLSA